MIDPISADVSGRPIIDAALSRLAQDLALASPDLAHIDASRILFVAGAGRLFTRASIRPLEPAALGASTKPSVVIEGVSMLYEICLRPRFFLQTGPEQRLMTIAHELWHASPLFDGTLAEDRRHHNAGPERIESEVTEIVDRFLDSGSDAAGFLSIVGELRMRAWLARPPSRIPAGSSLRRRYDERDLYLAIIQSRD